MTRTSSQSKKIAATAGIILAGLAAGPIAAIAMMKHLESTGALESEWSFGYLLTHIAPVFFNLFNLWLFCCCVFCPQDLAVKR